MRSVDWPVDSAGKIFGPARVCADTPVATSVAQFTDASLVGEAARILAHTRPDRDKFPWLKLVQQNKQSVCWTAPCGQRVVVSSSSWLIVLSELEALARPLVFTSMPAKLFRYTIKDGGATVANNVLDEDEDDDHRHHDVFASSSGQFNMAVCRGTRINHPRMIDHWQFGMCAGVHRAKFFIEKMFAHHREMRAAFITVGVGVEEHGCRGVDRSAPFECKWVGKHGWNNYGWNRTWQAGEPCLTHPWEGQQPFQVVDTLGLELDLCGAGTLTAFKNNVRLGVLATGLLAVQRKVDKTFYWVAEIRGPGGSIMIAWDGSTSMYTRAQLLARCVQ